MTVDSPHIAFLGIGLMGAPMTRNLLDAGFSMTLWNRTASKCDPFKDEATIADSPEQAVRDADVVITMLENSDVVEQVMVEQGAIGGLKSGTLVIDMSSAFRRTPPCRNGSGTGRGLCGCAGVGRDGGGR